MMYAFYLTLIVDKCILRIETVTLINKRGKHESKQTIGILKRIQP